MREAGVSYTKETAAATSDADASTTRGSDTRPLDGCDAIRKVPERQQAGGDAGPDTAMAGGSTSPVDSVLESEATSIALSGAARSRNKTSSVTSIAVVLEKVLRSTSTSPRPATPRNAAAISSSLAEMSMDASWSPISRSTRPPGTVRELLLTCATDALSALSESCPISSSGIGPPCRDFNGSERRKSLQGRSDVSTTCRDWKGRRLVFVESEDKVATRGTPGDRNPLHLKARTLRRALDAEERLRASGQEGRRGHQGYVARLLRERDVERSPSVDILRGCIHYADARHVGTPETSERRLE
eukprot:scaffold1484_cov241-Pinguiococcus_pyrenoidosus.AAC.5